MAKSRIDDTKEQIEDKKPLKKKVPQHFSFSKKDIQFFSTHVKAESEIEIWRDQVRIDLENPRILQAVKKKYYFIYKKVGYDEKALKKEVLNMQVTRKRMQVCSKAMWIDNASYVKKELECYLKDRKRILLAPPDVKDNKKSNPGK